MAIANMVSPVKSCGHCHRPLEDQPLTCSGCFNVSYCDEDCQRPHWKYHKKVCKAQGTDLSPAAQKAQDVAVSQSVIPARAAAPPEDDDQKENFFLPRAALHQALQGKQKRWAEKHSVREHLRTQIFPLAVQNWTEFDYTLKPGLNAFFKKKVALNALDLGAGNCSNVSVLIDVGFIHITAVDHLKGFQELGGKTVQALKLDAESELLKVAILEKNITSTDLELFPRDASLGAIIARRIFEFCPPDDFEDLLIASYDSLEQGGCFIVSVNLLDSTKPDLYDPYWKGGEWGFTSSKEVRTVVNFLKSLGFGVLRLNIGYGLYLPEVLFFCQKF